MHFLVAFAPKIHVQLEFSLVSKIDLASASRAVCSVLLTDIPDREQGPSDARRLRLLERLSSRTVLARHPSAPDS